MYFGDHAPPYSHAEYQGFEVVVGIQDAMVIEGRFPPRAMGLVVEWTLLHQPELLGLWTKAENLQPLSRIAPLA